jgi:Uncharacterised protein family (UPF0158)
MQMHEDKRRLKVNLDDLQGAFDSAFAEMWHYLDLDTGDVVLVTEDHRRQLEALFEDTDAETIEAINAAIQNEAMPDDEKDSLYTAAQVEFGYNSRFVEIPQADSRQGYEDMEAFIEMVSNRHLRELLQVAIQGKGAFRRFKDVLATYPQERERWFRFHDESLRQRVLDWLAMENIDPTL